MKGISPELMAQIEAERRERAARVSKIWREGLTHKDWLFDGHPIRGKIMLERFNALQWDDDDGDAVVHFTLIESDHED